MSELKIWKHQFTDKTNKTAEKRRGIGKLVHKNNYQSDVEDSVAEET